MYAPNLAHISLLLVTLSLPASAQQIVTYQGFASTISCTGAHFQCTDGGALCCALPTGYGYSVQFTALPAGAQGQGYAHGRCSDFVFAVYGPGTRCWNGGGDSVTNMNWFHSPLRARSGGGFRREAHNCSSPATFVYVGKGGVERKILVPQEAGAAQVMADLFGGGNLDALDEYDEL